VQEVQDQCDDGSTDPRDRLPIEPLQPIQRAAFASVISLPQGVDFGRHDEVVVR
jgi:hypothetical protein